ncbi:MAG: NRDE family protein [Planctomycetota bacterium]
MCTVTIHRLASALSVTMNRDESRLRAAEEPPTLRLPEAAPAVLAPRDGAAGGSWCGVNDRGVVACLLNLYSERSGPGPEVPPGGRTRGDLIDIALQGTCAASARARVEEEVRPGVFSPFRLAVVTPEDGWLVIWRGHGAIEVEELGGEWVFLTSSSWRAREVLPWREERFSAWRGEGAEEVEGIPTFHLWQPAGREEWAPLVSRERSVTRSITGIIVEREPGQASMRYWVDPTAAARAPDAKAVLPLRAPAAPESLP